MNLEYRNLSPQGWECPRCGAINSPFQPQCFCSSNSKTYMTSDSTLTQYRSIDYGPGFVSTKVVDIVKCKDCKRKYLKGMEMYCPERVHAVSLNGYCENGEEKR